MRKPELIDNIALATQLPKKNVETVVNAMLGNIIETLAKGEEVRFMGFGTFSSYLKKATTGHNPRTGEKIDIPAKYVPTFRAGETLKQQVHESLSAKDKKAKKKNKKK